MQLRDRRDKLCCEVSADDPRHDQRLHDINTEFKSDVSYLLSMTTLREKAPGWLQLEATAAKLTEPIATEGRNIICKGWQQLYLDHADNPERRTRVVAADQARQASAQAAVQQASAAAAAAAKRVLECTAALANGGTVDLSALVADAATSFAGIEPEDAANATALLVSEVADLSASTTSRKFLVGLPRERGPPLRAQGASAVLVQCT